MKVVINLVFIFNFVFTLQAYALESKNVKIVSTFIEYIKNDNKEKLSTMLHFPLNREYPLPSINNKKDFLKKYNEIFDSNLINIIKKSSATEDWSEVGWRGIMLSNGLMWLDYDGKIIAVNYQSNVEKLNRKNIIEKDKKLLHKSLRVFKEPVLLWETKNYKIRIDNLGNNKYRYSSWNINKLQSEKPDLILNNGLVTFEGNAGNHFYEFKNGIYKYRCNVWELGANDTPKGELFIYKNDNEILYEKARSN
jgi:hypothetical protein